MSYPACYSIIKMNEEETFQYGPFTVTVHPATNEEDEWYEVEESDWHDRKTLINLKNIRD